MYYKSVFRMGFSSAVGGKTGKTSVLPGFSNIGSGRGSGSKPHCTVMVVLPSPGARHAGGAAAYHGLLRYLFRFFKMIIHLDFMIKNKFPVNHKERSSFI